MLVARVAVTTAAITATDAFQDAVPAQLAGNEVGLTTSAH